MEFAFDNSYARDLEGFYREVRAAAFTKPHLVAFNRSLASELGMPELIDDDQVARLIVGAWVPEGAQPLAQVYAGHQFGSFSPRLGDGRALLVGELIDVDGHRRDIHLKGSGPTPFSRGGDGKATLGPMLREYLVGEAMHGLGIPTTRALGVATTGDMVMRESPLPGAVLARVASSHLRVGTFEYFSSTDRQDDVGRLAAYAIARHYPEVETEDNPPLGLLREVCRAQAELVARWMLVGFVHGVMNTDNVTISGEAIDFGPCAFIDAYDPGAVFSSIDRHGRYAYGNQPGIALWNLSRFAETLLPLIDEVPARAVERATATVEGFVENYERAWLTGMRAKLGLPDAEPRDVDLVNEFLSLLAEHGVDFTLAFRSLSAAVAGDEEQFTGLFEQRPAAAPWLGRWRERLGLSDDRAAETSTAMDETNPVYIPRNHLTEDALTAAVAHGNFAPFERMVDLVSAPFVEQPDAHDHARPAPPGFGPYRTFCGT